MLRGILLVLMVLASGIAQAERQVPQNQAQMSLSFGPIVQATTPAIVNIYAQKIVAGRQSPFANDPFFGQFFNLRQQPRIENSLGSGVMLSADGLVVTNQHVVGNAQEIRVVLSDRREFDADILLADREIDLAILKLRDAHDLPFLDLADSDRAIVGDLVLAIGNPFGIGQTVTSGIISGVARSGGASTERSYLIQTDAAINPGNSGGALVNMEGDLIGVNTSILTRSGGSNGIGFAVPANLVGAVMAQALSGARQLVRPWAGILAQTIDYDMARATGLERPRGVLVSQIHPQSALAQRDVQVGDLILSVDGFDVNSQAEFEYRLMVSGDVARVGILRAGAEEILEIVPAPAPDEPRSHARRITENSPLHGLEVARINPAIIELLDLSLDSRGVVVLASDSFAGRFGLRTGDIISGINGEEVEDAEDVIRHARSNARLWSIDLIRGGQRTQLRFRI